MRIVLALFVLALAVGSVSAWQTSREQESLNEHLEVFRPLLGKTFRGEFANSTPEKPVIVISSFERASGRAYQKFVCNNLEGKIAWLQNTKLQYFWY